LEPSPPVRSFAPWVPPAVAEVVHRALAIDRAHRFPSASAMLDAMRPLLRDGWALEPSMLVGLSPDERAPVASRAPEATADALGTPALSAASASPDALSAEATSTHASPVPGEPRDPRDPATLDGGGRSATVAGETAAVAPATRAIPAQGRSARGAPAIAAAALAGVAIASLVVLRPWNRGPAAAPPAVADTARGSAAPPAEPAPAVVVAAPTARSVSVAMQPTDATAEVDGAPVSTADGAIAIAGAVGSVHHVRIQKGALASEADVTITESGAKPARLELAAATPSPRDRPRGPGAGTSAGAATPAPAATPSAKLRTTFE
jgi:serine/threonine-protein kinase